MQVEQSCADLMRKLLRALLTHRELALLKVSEQVSTVQLLHDDVNIVLVLKDVEQADDVGVLAHLENLYLSTLELDILHGHVLLCHDLDCDCLAGLLVDGRLHQAKLAFAKRVVYLVVVKHVCVSNHLLDSVQPFLFLFFACQIVRTGLIGRKDQFEWIQDSCAVQLLLRLVFDEHAH